MLWEVDEECQSLPYRQTLHQSHGQRGQEGQGRSGFRTGQVAIGIKKAHFINNREMKAEILIASSITMSDSK